MVITVSKLKVIPRSMLVTDTSLLLLSGNLGLLLQSLNLIQKLFFAPFHFLESTVNYVESLSGDRAVISVLFVTNINVVGLLFGLQTTSERRFVVGVAEDALLIVIGLGATSENITFKFILIQLFT
jgi:hypothetical protein